jgi:sortase A
MLLLALCMVSLMGGVSANALSYSIDGAEIKNTTQPTSITDYAVPAADVAANLDKNAAYAPPAFGSPESYIPNRSEPLIDLRGTDGSSYGAVVGDGSLDGYAASSDVRVVNGFPAVDNGPVVAAQPATAYTELTAQDYYAGGRIGNIKIPAIGVDFAVYEGADAKTMNKGAAHITNTSVWDGNVCLAAHNRGVVNNFGKIQTLHEGDSIELTTAHGTRTYRVYRVEKIAETDVSILAPSAGNMITLTTCVANERAFRYVVQAAQI